MRVFGLTGGIGSGKSSVAGILEAHGVAIVRADDIGRELMARDRPGFQPIVEAFGDGILSADAEINRRRLADRVFADAAERTLLNDILHPLIRQRSLQAFAAIEARGAPVAVYESALLMETGRDREMDAVILVTAPAQARVARVCARDHVSPDQVARRMATQIDERSARARASFVIENDGSLESLRIGTLALASRALMISNPAPEPPGAADA